MTNFTSNVSLADKTTYGIGGPARLYCAPSTREDIVSAIAWANEKGAPLLVLGNGSNLLVSDAGWPGLALDLAERWTSLSWDGATARCDGGALLHTLVKESVDRGLAGLEALAGIPGSVGGAVVMNAGAFGQSVADRLQTVDYVDVDTAEEKSLSVQDIESSYRATVFTGGGALVVSATFGFVPDPRGEARQTFREVLAKRKDRHPLDMPNCGSVFTNPPGAGAGRLIEQCGLKGTIRGGAQVSVKHANFIVNTGAATAAHVRSLIVFVQKTVFDKTGILLKPEVRFAGEFSEPLFTPR